jgi:copper chaperone CopZ
MTVEGRASVALRVSDMTCPRCEAGVQAGLLEETGVLEVSADWQKGIARVTYDPEQTSPERLLQACVFSGPSAGGRHQWRAEIALPAADCCR